MMAWRVVAEANDVPVISIWSVFAFGITAKVFACCYAEAVFGWRAES